VPGAGRLPQRVLRVAGSWAEPTEQEGQALLERIRGIGEDSRGTSGAPRVWAELRASGVRCGRKRVARLMRAAGLLGACRRRRGLTVRDPRAAPAPDLVKRQFRAAGPDRLWVADFKQSPTREDALYLGVGLDVWSRGVVGWAMCPDARAELGVDALEMALWRRKPAPGVGPHSDRGAQYTSLRFGARLRAGILPSRGRTGDAYDNALCEAFFVPLERKVLDRHRFPTREEARSVLFSYLEGVYNRRAGTQLWVTYPLRSSRGGGGPGTNLSASHSPRKRSKSTAYRWTPLPGRPCLPLDSGV
jgi:putative transposase